MTLVYAAAADLTAWMNTDAPSNAAALLRTASINVREATQTAYYAVDITGMPTDAVVLQAFKDATCSTAAAMSVQGVDPLGGGVSQGIESSSGIGTAKITYTGTDLIVAAQAQLVDGISREAARILRQAGLYMNAPWVTG